MRVLKWFKNRPDLNCRVSKRFTLNSAAISRCLLDGFGPSACSAFRTVVGPDVGDRVSNTQHGIAVRRLVAHCSEYFTRPIFWRCQDF